MMNIKFRGVITKTTLALILHLVLLLLCTQASKVSAFSCSGQADGNYCGDSSKFYWCAGGVAVATMTCSPGTVCACGYALYNPCLTSAQQLPAGCTPRGPVTPTATPTATPTPTPTKSTNPTPTPTPNTCTQRVTNCAVDVPSLMFHYVETPATHDPVYTTDATFFLQILDWIKNNGYVTVTMEQVHNALTNSGSLPCKPIHLRFDDGYSGHQFVVDSLRAKNMVGTFYISSGLRDNGQYMSTSQLYDWATDMEIGDHARWHDDLTTLSAAGILDNTCGSASSTAAMIGKPVKTHAYPYGSYNSQVESIASQCFDMALSVNYGIEWRCDTMWDQPTIDMKYIHTIYQLENAVNGVCIDC